MDDRRQPGDRRLSPGAAPDGVERRRGGRRREDLPGRRGPALYLRSLVAGLLGVGAGLALSAGDDPPPAVAAAAPAAPSPAATPAPRAPDHAELVAMRRTLEGLTPTDLLLDADVAAHWILVSEDLQGRLETETHPDTRTELATLDAQLRALGVTKSPTP